MGTSYYGVIENMLDKYKCETKIRPSTCHDVTTGIGTGYHSIVLLIYIPVRATGIMTENKCSKAMTGPIIVQQGYDRPNDIKAEQSNV